LERKINTRNHSFHVYIGDRIESDDKTGFGNLARYIIRACFSQERMVYISVNLMMLPRLVTPSKAGNPEKFLMPWIGLPGWEYIFLVDMNIL